MSRCPYPETLEAMMPRLLIAVLLAFVLGCDRVTPAEAQAPSVPALVGTFDLESANGTPIPSKIGTSLNRDVTALASFLILAAPPDDSPVVHPVGARRSCDGTTLTVTASGVYDERRVYQVATELISAGINDRGTYAAERQADGTYRLCLFSTMHRLGEPRPGWRTLSATLDATGLTYAEDSYEQRNTLRWKVRR